MHLLYIDIDPYRTNLAEKAGKDILIDSDGKGKVQISGITLGAFTGVGKRDTYAFDMGAGQYAGLALVQDASSSTGWNAVIVQGANSANSITIRHFDRNAAQNPQSENGYLGIRIPQANQVALVETGTSGAAGASSLTAGAGTSTGGPSYWSTIGANTSALAGKTSSFFEKEGKSFTVYLSASAKQGDTLTLALAGSTQGLKAVLGDSTVLADGAVITLVEGQVQASFSLVSDAGISADQVGGQTARRSHCKHYRKRSVLRPYDADIGGIFHKYSVPYTIPCRHDLNALLPLDGGNTWLA